MALFSRRFFLLVCFLGLYDFLGALPKGAEPVFGRADIEKKGGALEITTSEKAFIQWKEFSLEKGEKIHFLQPNSHSSVVNQVMGGKISHIAGEITSNAKVYLVNPQGVIFSKEAKVEVSSLVVSTLPFSVEAYVEGAPLVCKGNSEAAIIHFGKIEATEEDVLFLARKIENAGEIKALEGSVCMGAGYEIIIKPSKDKILHIRPKTEMFSKKAKITSSGIVEALKTEMQTERSAYHLAVCKEADAVSVIEQDGEIFLKSSELEITGNIVSDKIYLSSDEITTFPSSLISVKKGGNHLEANRVFNHLGKLLVQEGNLKINIDSEEGMFFQKGEIILLGEKGVLKYDAPFLYHSGKTLLEKREGSIELLFQNYIDTAESTVQLSTEDKGEIHFLGEKKSTFFSSGKIEASAKGKISIQAEKINLAGAHIKAESGALLLGGLSSENIVCDHLFLNWTSELDVSAQKQGKGGTIHLFSKGFLENGGTLLAKGGEFLGDGGLVEISSSQELNHIGTIHVEAPCGKSGAIIFDPKNIFITEEAKVRYPQFEIVEPFSQEGGEFGGEIHPIKDGNVIISRCKVGEGVVYLFNGFTGQLIGATFGKGGGALSSRIAKGGITVLSNEDYLISSPDWFEARGALTLVDHKTGHPKIGPKNYVCFENSITGSLQGEKEAVSSGGVLEVSPGFIVVISPQFSVKKQEIGAVTPVFLSTLQNGFVVGEENSIYGDKEKDRIGSGGVVVLPNRNYLILSPEFSSLEAKNIGAVTFVTFDQRVGFPVTEKNSLHGVQEQDQVGSGGAISLQNGNYVVFSPFWKEKRGAVTLMNGETGFDMQRFSRKRGSPVSPYNSLCGSYKDDRVGSHGALLLKNGNYVVISPFWKEKRGAVTLLKGDSGKDLQWFSRGPGLFVTEANSLTGENPEDLVGISGVLPFSQGYMVLSGNYKIDQKRKAGAITFIKEDTGTSFFQEKEGPSLKVTHLNSLHGAYAKDRLGEGVSKENIHSLGETRLLILAPFWHGERGCFFIFDTEQKKITWGDKASSNLFPEAGFCFQGEKKGDRVGASFLDLSEKHFAILSPNWKEQRGAVTVFDKKEALPILDKATGVVTPFNSFTGKDKGDLTGSCGYVLENDHFLISSPGIKGGGREGAITLLDKKTGLSVKEQRSFPCYTNSLYGIKVEAFSQALENVVAFEKKVILSQPFLEPEKGSKVSVIALVDKVEGVSGFIDRENSILVEDESCFQREVILKKDPFNGSYILGFPGENFSTGKVRVGITNPNSITFTKAASKTLNITPRFLEELLQTGVSVTLQANNDIFLCSPLQFTKQTKTPGELVLKAGKSIFIKESISMGPHSLQILGNEPLCSGVVDPQREEGSAFIAFSAETKIASEGGNLSFSLFSGKGKTYSESGVLWIGDKVSIKTDSGKISFLAEENTIFLKEGSSISSREGDILLIGGMHIQAMEDAEIVTTGKGKITLVVDQLEKTGKCLEKGKVDILHVTLASKTAVQIFASERALSQFPQKINGATYAPSLYGKNSSFEKWGVSYPEGVASYPFTIFYKEGENAAKSVMVFNIQGQQKVSLPQFVNRFFPVEKVLIEPFHKWIRQKKVFPNHIFSEDTNLQESGKRKPQFTEKNPI